jgi:hypothetical protein
LRSILCGSRTVLLDRSVESYPYIRFAFKLAVLQRRESGKAEGIPQARHLARHLFAVL